MSKTISFNDYYGLITKNSNFMINVSNSNRKHSVKRRQGKSKQNVHKEKPTNLNQFIFFFSGKDI